MCELLSANPYLSIYFMACLMGLIPSYQYLLDNFDDDHTITLILFLPAAVLWPIVVFLGCYNLYQKNRQVKELVFHRLNELECNNNDSKKSISYFYEEIQKLKLSTIDRKRQKK